MLPRAPLHKSVALVGVSGTRPLNLIRRSDRLDLLLLGGHTNCDVYSVALVSRVTFRHSSSHSAAQSKMLSPSSCTPFDGEANATMVPHVSSAFKCGEGSESADITMMMMGMMDTADEGVVTGCTRTATGYQEGLAGPSREVEGAEFSVSGEGTNDFMHSMVAEGFTSTANNKSLSIEDKEGGRKEKKNRVEKKRQRKREEGSNSRDPAETGADARAGKTDKKLTHVRAKTVRKLRRQLQFLAAKELEMETAHRKAERAALRRRARAVSAAADHFSPSFTKKAGGSGTDSNAHNKSKNTDNTRREQYLREEFERLRKQRINFNTVPDDLKELLPANDALETAMAFSILSHKDARAHLDFTHKLLKSNLLSLAAPVGWWDPYDVKPQAFAIDQYAALPVFTNVTYLQHFCHQYNFTVRDPSGTLWSDGGNVAVDPPQLAPPSPWRRGGEDRRESSGEEHTTEMQHAKSTLSSLYTEKEGKSSFSVAASIIEAELESAGSILGKDKVKARKEERERAMRARQEEEKEKGNKSLGVGGDAADSSTPAMERLVVDRVAARKFEDTIVQSNASVDAEEFASMLCEDDGPAEGAATGTSPKKEGSDQVVGHHAPQEEDNGESADLLFESMMDPTAMDFPSSHTEADQTFAPVDTKDSFIGDADSKNAQQIKSQNDATADTKKKLGVKHTRKAVLRRRRKKKIKDDEEARRKAARQQEAEWLANQRVAAKEKEDAEAKEKLWSALDATPRAMKKSTVVTPLITYGPFIRPYFVGYYADFRTLLHNASIVPKMVDIIVNPGSPLETIISRAAAKETVTNQSLLRVAYNRVEHQLRAEFHNFFLSYCKKGEVQLAKSYCMAQPAPEGVKDEDTLYDIVIMVDCDDFHQLTNKMRKAKQRGILRGHSSLHVVPIHDVPDFMLEGSTVFFECDDEFKRPEYTPVDFYAESEGGVKPESSHMEGELEKASDARHHHQQQDDGPAQSSPPLSGEEDGLPSHMQQSSASKINTNIPFTSRLDPATLAALEAFRNTKTASSSTRATSGSAKRDAHAHAPKTVGRFKQLGSHTTISTRADATSIYSDPTNQSTEAFGLAAQRFRLGVGAGQ